MKSLILLSLFASASAFASGSPVVTCLDMTDGSRLQFKFYLDRMDNVDEPKYYDFNDNLIVEEVLDNAGNTADLLDLKPYVAKKNTGRYLFGESKKTKDGEISEEFNVAFKSANGSMVTVKVDNENDYDNKRSKMSGEIEYYIAAADQPKKHAAIKPVVKNTKRAWANRVECEYSWD